MKITKIRNEGDLFEIIRRKIIQRRQKVVRKISNGSKSKKDYPAWETETRVISEKTILPEKAFNSLVSRYDVKKLNGKEVDDFKFKEGKTTVADIIDFFFPGKKK